jgi:uncharacterized protein with PIN domain
MVEWVRRCPECGRELRKADPLAVVKCVCGWVWGFRGRPMVEWVRRCPECGRELRKADPLAVVKCVCGWVWGFRAIRLPDWEEFEI